MESTSKVRACTSSTYSVPSIFPTLTNRLIIKNIIDHKRGFFVIVDNGGSKFNSRVNGIGISQTQTEMLE